MQHLPMLSYQKANSAIFSYHWVNFKVLTVFVVKYCFLVRARGFIWTIGSEKGVTLLPRRLKGVVPNALHILTPPQVIIS